MAQFFQVRHSVEDPDDPKGLCRISQLAGAIIVVVGTAVLAGWAFNVARLKTVMPGWAKMSPMTALAFVSSGAALWCIAGLLLKGPGHGDGTRSVTQRRAARLAAGLTAMLGTTKVADHILGLNLGIDSLGFHDEIAPGIAAAQMAPATALGFLLTGCAMLISDRTRLAASFQCLALLIGLNGCLGLFRYVFGGETWLVFQFMAVHTSACFVILSMGLFCLQPRRGLVEWAIDDRSSRKISWPLGLVLAVSLSTITLLVRIAIGSGLDGPTLIIFSIPIILSAYWGGFWIGLLSTLISSLGAAYFVLDPLFSFNAVSSSSHWQVAVLFLSGILISTICLLLARARDQADVTIERLAESEDRLHTVAENLNEGLVVCDLDESILYWNRAALKMHGFTNHSEGMWRLPEFSDLFTLSLLDGTTLSLDQWPMRRILRGEQISAFEVRVRRTDLKWEKVFRYSGTIAQGAAGKSVAFVSIEDISDRVKAEQALRESRQLLVQAQQAGKVGSWWSDFQSEGENLFWSEETHRICGIPESQFDHRVDTFYMHVHPDDRGLVRKASTDAVEHGTPYAIEHRMIRPDGSEIWVHERADVIRDQDGKAIRMVGICQDITERKRFDDMLMQIAKGVSADTGDSFFRSLAHHLTAAMSVDYAMVAELVPDNPTVVRTIAVSGGGALQVDIKYETMHTPCAMTLLHQNFSVPAGVVGQFPDDVMLRELQVESYIGSTLRGADNQPIGLIAVMNRKSIENLKAIEAILQIFGVRAAAELNRRTTEQELIRSRQRLDMAVRGAQLGVWDIHIPSGAIIHDDRWREMLGYEERDIEPDIQSWEKLIHPEDHGRVMSCWADHLAGRTNYYESEYRLLARSGRWKWILDQGMVVEHDEAGRPIRAVGTHMDIDDRRRAAAAIEEWKSRYEAAIHASRQIMYDWDTHTNQITVAGATERLIGCSPDDLNTLEKWESRVHPDDLPAFQEEVRRVAGSLDPFHLEYRVRRSDGGYLEAEDHGFFFADADGKRTRMIGFLSDITSRNLAERERRRLEMELSHKQKMEAVGNLASGIAHDFGNVLTAIQGHLALAIRGLLPDHPARKSLGMVEQAARQGADMTKSITTFGRKMPSDKAPCALGDLVADSLRLFRHLLPGNVEIQFSKPANGGPWIHAASSQIQQVVMNLIFNARDAMPAGGILRVRVAAVARTEALSVPSIAFASPKDPTFNSPAESVNLSVADHAAVLSVVDTGCGMDEHTLRRLFEPFFTTKDRQHGTGLGLAMVHGIITDHGGWIAVASMPGKGSRFDLFLPLCLASPSEPAGADVVASIPAHRPRFVLVLYPNDFVLEIMTTSLESSGYVVVVAQSPDHLTQLVSEHRDEVGAIIVDADSLPESDRPPVFALQVQMGDVPLVVLSSNMARFLDEPQAAQFSILPKPFQMSKLISLVDRAVGVIPSGAQ